jgi:hypothetical protein
VRWAWWLLERDERLRRSADDFSTARPGKRVARPACQETRRGQKQAVDKKSDDCKVLPISSSRNEADAVADGGPFEVMNGRLKAGRGREGKENGEASELRSLARVRWQSRKMRGGDGSGIALRLRGVLKGETLQWLTEDGGY